MSSSRIVQNIQLNSETQAWVFSYEKNAGKYD